MAIVAKNNKPLTNKYTAELIQRRGLADPADSNLGNSIQISMEFSLGDAAKAPHCVSEGLYSRTLSGCALRGKPKFHLNRQNYDLRC